MASLYDSGIAEQAGGTVLLIIDPQNDFHPHTNGSLAVAGADKDAERIAAFIGANSAAISGCVVTLDSHQAYHIGHGGFWEDAEGNHPSPFTIIAGADVKGDAPKWRAARAEHRQWGVDYVAGLEANGRFQLCVWPDHCLIGTTGHAVEPAINGALQAWARAHKGAVEYVAKGMNALSEHYSALRADVEVPGDPSTGVNAAVIERLKRAGRVVVCGQALSHCVNFTVRDLVAHWPEDAASRARIVLLTDCASPVPGFEAAGEKFVADMREAGLTLTTSAELKL